MCACVCVCVCVCVQAPTLHNECKFKCSVWNFTQKITKLGINAPGWISILVPTTEAEAICLTAGNSILWPAGCFFCRFSIGGSMIFTASTGVHQRRLLSRYFACSHRPHGIPDIIKYVTAALLRGWSCPREWQKHRHYPVQNSSMKTVESWLTAVLLTIVWTHCGSATASITWHS